MKLATLCYVHDGDKILMIERNKRDTDMFKGYWNGLGGKLNDGESPEECVIRELKEESGLTIKNPTFKGIITLPNNRDTEETWYLFVFVAHEFEGNLVENEEGKLSWINKKDIPTLRIQNADKLFIKWLDKKEIFSAKFYYVGDQLKDHSVTFY